MTGCYCHGSDHQHCTHPVNGDEVCCLCDEED